MGDTLAFLLMGQSRNGRLVMHALSASEMVRAWELGRRKHPVDLALLLLALASPEQPPAELGGLTVGQRNTRLLTLRQMTLGGRAECLMHCPLCHQLLEFALDIETLLMPEPVEFIVTQTVEAFTIHFRLPTSLDLAALVECVDVQTGRQLLLERCVLQAEHDGLAVAPANLPERVIQAVSEAMVEKDPQAEMQLILNCFACQHTWTAIFDIVSFLWTEIEAQAKQLLREVHVLARAYGWRESDILALSAPRRQLYLELIG